VQQVGGIQEINFFIFHYFNTNLIKLCNEHSHGVCVSGMFDVKHIQPNTLHVCHKRRILEQCRHDKMKFVMTGGG
jgi:hypothetical protein